MQAIRIRKRAAWLPAVAALALSACAAPATPPRTPPALPDSFSETGADAVDAAWWRAYRDPGLDAAVARALDRNPGLAEKRGRLRAARAAARAAGAARLPEVGLRADARRERDQAGIRPEGYGLGASASFEIDLWGRASAEADAAALDARAREADLQAARVALAGEVADAWHRLAGARREARLLRDRVEVERDARAAVAARVRNGLAARTDLIARDDALARSAAALADVRALKRIQAARLAALLDRAGDPPSGPAAVAALPDLPASGVPARAIERRPDVARARLAMRAADRRLDQAVAARYPRITLSLDANTSAQAPANLFSAWLAGLVAEAAAPLFDGGRRAADAERAAGDLGAAVAAYRARVLDAFEEVETALADYAAARDRLDAADARAAVAAETRARLKTRFRAGLAARADVLDARAAAIDADLGRAAARRDALRAYAALARALSGPPRLHEPAGGLE